MIFKGEVQANVSRFVHVVRPPNPTNSDIDILIHTLVFLRDTSVSFMMVSRLQKGRHAGKSKRGRGDGLLLLLLLQSAYSFAYEMPLPRRRGPS
jgi:hypothetical protein